MVSEHQLGCQNLGERCQNLGEKRYGRKILSRQDMARSLDFSLDVISLLVSQFDLQKKKYCIQFATCCLHWQVIDSVVASVKWCIRPGQYILLLVYQTQALTSRVKKLPLNQFELSAKLKGERYLNWEPRNGSTVLIQISAVKAYTNFIWSTIP